MRRNNPTLLDYMESWQGEQCWLRAQGNRIYLEWDRSYHTNSFNQLISKGIGLFENLARKTGSRKVEKEPGNSGFKENTINNNNNSRSKSRRSKSPLQYRHKNQSKPISHPNSRGSQPNYQIHHNHCNQYQPQQQQKCFEYINSTKKNKPIIPKNFNPVQSHTHPQDDSSQSKIESIMESIREIKLPKIEQCSPQYKQAHRKFEAIKQGILQKIASDNIEFELNDILGEIQEAADQIIRKHQKGKELPPTELKKNAFSFNEYMIQPIADNQGVEEQLSQISEDNSNLIKLPAFKDSAKSISSIFSDLGHRREEDSGKINNIFISNAEGELDGLKSAGPECKIQENLPTSSTHIKTQVEVKLERQKMDQCAELVNDKKESSVSGNKEEGSKVPSQVLPLASKMQNYSSPEKKSSITYIPHTPNSPFKIASNLQEAKQIDPQIVKFTEYKVKFLQPSVKQPQIVKFASPLRFRRKEEVVKCLVANQVVEKESNSIEFNQ